MQGQYKLTAYSALMIMFQDTEGSSLAGSSSISLFIFFSNDIALYEAHYVPANITQDKQKNPILVSEDVPSCEFVDISKSEKVSV